jgi:D-glycero-D-manno-heptose 1,7-bisphosphate phosphatase
MYNSLERRTLFGSRSPSPVPALFLDRDGVIIEDRHYLCDPDQVQLCAGALQLIQAAADADWPVVVITNQSGISRGLFNWDSVERVNASMLALLGSSDAVAAIYANGHGPDAPLQSWRKPSPAMLLEAAKALNLDLGCSLLIGDRLSDLKAGVAAGLAEVCHVLTGHGQRERPAVQAWNEQRCQQPPVATDVVASTRTTTLQLLASLEAFPLERLQPLIPLPT